MLAVMLVVVASSGVTAGAQQPPPPNVPDRSIVDGSAQRALNSARARWRALKIRSYDFQARRSCFCPPTGWRLVKVRNTLPVKTTKLDVKEIASVPRLFRVIQRAIDGKVHRLTVRYGARGMPSKISIDSVQYIADEEQYFNTRRFRRR